MPWKTVLFDFDGTLFDTVEGITKSIQYALRKHGMDDPLDRLRCFAGPPLVDKFMEVYHVSSQQAEQLVVDFRERYIPIGVYESRPFPGIRELLSRLRAAGLRLGVATSKPQNMAELLLGRAQLQDLFDVIVGSRPGINNQEKWQIVFQAMELCGTDPASTVLIGDTKYDVLGAKRCSVPCIGVGWGYAEPGELESAGAVCVVRDMEELAQLLTEASAPETETIDPSLQETD